MCYQWKVKSQCPRGDQCSFRHDGHERAKPTPITAPPSESPKQKKRWKCVEKKEPQRPESIWEVRSTAVQRLLVFAPNHLVTIGILPNVNFMSESVFESQPRKKAEGGWFKQCSSFVENVRQLGCIFQDTERPESLSILRKSTSLGITSTSPVHKSDAASYKHPRTHLSVARKNSSQSSSSAKSLRHEM